MTTPNDPFRTPGENPNPWSRDASGPPNQPPQGPSQPGPQGPQQGQGQPSRGQAPQGQPPQGQGAQPPYGQAPQGPQGQPHYGQHPQGQPPQGVGYPGAQPGQPYPQNPQNGQPRQFASAPMAPNQPTPNGATPTGPAPKSKLPWIAGGVGGLLVVSLLASQLMGGKDEPQANPQPPAVTSAAPASTETTTAEATATDATTTADSSQTSTGTTTGDADMSTPEGAVKALFDALQAGDADALLAAAYDTPSDSTFITNEVLAKASGGGVVSDVVVTPPASKNGDVTVNYTVAGKKVTEKLSAIGSPDRGYKVHLYPGATSLHEAKAATVGLKINGIEVTEDRAVLLPGVYDVTTSSPWYGLNSKTLTVTQFSKAQTSPLKAALSPKATTDIRAAAKAQLASCLKNTTKTLENPDCGIAFREQAYTGEKARKDYLRCAVKSGASTLDRAVLKPKYVDPLQVDGDIAVKLRCELKATNGSPLVGETTLYRFAADLSGKTITVVFD